jgi:hypothetical protein
VRFMKRQFIITSILALGMGIAQAQTQQMQPAPMQGGSNDPRQMQQPRDTAPAGAAQGMGPGGVSQAAAQSFKGCLNGSGGSWTLTSDKGKSMNLSGTDNQLSPYQGQEVRIQGVEASDGSITVSSIDKVSEACANQAASTGGQSSTTSQNDINSQSSTSSTSTTSQSATATTPSSADNMSQSTQAPATSTAPDNSNAATSQTSSTSTSGAAAATTPPVTNQTPENTVGSGQTGQSSAESTASSATGQNADQGVRHYSDMDQNAGNNNASDNAGSKLPQTASPLPLLGLLGLGSLVTGVVSRRKK